MSDYDPDTERVYVENGGGFCPECDHDEPLVSRPGYPNDGGISVEYKCPICQAQWIDFYILDQISQAKAGKFSNQQQLFAAGGAK